MTKNFDPNFVPERISFLVGVKVLITNEQGEILVLKRNNKTGKGWSFPGGGIDHGETVYQAAVREINEETGLKVKNLRVFSVNTHLKEKNKSAIIIGFVAEYGNGEIKLNWEHTSYKWLRPSEALGLDLTKDGRYFVEEYEKNLTK